MDLRQKIGQLMTIEIPGKQLTDETAAFIRECHPACVVLFGSNWAGPWAGSKLIADMQAVAAESGDAPLLICMDQEGGQVSHLRYPAAEMPSNMGRAAAGGPEVAGEAAEIMGREMVRLGINLASAPVVDVNTNPANPVIGTRAFSDDPKLVAACGVAAVEGLRRAGCLSMAKHFPGHGDTWVDSHLDLPVVEHGWERMRAVELAPFRVAIEAGVDSIVTAHVIYRGIDDSGLPATLSHRIMTGLLREELGFEGVTFADALVMDAIARHNSAYIPPAAIAAVRAGMDSLMVFGSLESQKRCYYGLLGAVESGLISMDRLDEAARRVQALRERVAPAQPDATWPDMEHQRAARRIALSAVTLVRDEQGLLPLTGDGEGLGLVEFASGRLSPVEGGGNEPLTGSTLAFLLDRHLPRARYIALQSSVPHSQEQLRAFLAGCDRVLVATRQACLEPRQAELLRLIADTNKPIVHAALRAPYDAALEPRIGTVLLTYGDQPTGIAGLVDVLTGAATAQGRLPVRLPSTVAAV
ncbi:MAG: glycoside hydrolase family 3 protein [Chloroflexota bacterium]|nr:glycoside hydrolase family 3 protein [Chloroflexota bacterium]